MADVESESIVVPFPAPAALPARLRTALFREREVGKEGQVHQGNEQHYDQPPRLPAGLADFTHMTMKTTRFTRGIKKRRMNQMGSLAFLPYLAFSE